MNKNLYSKSKTAVIWDLSGAFVRQFAGLFITILLARLLGPLEFGIIAFALVFIHISEVFLDAGFTSGLVQQKNTKDIAFSSIFYVNLVISLFLSLIILASSGWIATLYKQPRIEEILNWLALIPPIAAMGKVQDAILTKNLDFKSLTIRSLVATLVGGVLGVIAAYSDFGVYSLVIQQIALTVTATIMLWYATKWRPKLEYSSFEVKRLFSYSSYVFFDRLLRQVANKIDTIFVGIVFSPIVLGYYSRAASLKTQIQTYTTNSLSRVIFPMLSQLQDDEEKFKETYFKIFNIVTGLTVFLVAPLYFLSQFIIILLLGDQWQPTVILFQILILTTLTSPQVNMMGRAILAKGYSKLKFTTGLLQRVLKLLPIGVGLFYGIEEFAIAMVISSLFAFVVLSKIYEKKLEINFWVQIKNFLVPNFIFMIYIAIHFYFRDNINQWLFAGSFLLIQIMFIILIKHDSYLFIKNNANKILIIKNAK
jgi:O-antigen/teichoic acid export membrane protein